MHTDIFLTEENPQRNDRQKSPIPPVPPLSSKNECTKSHYRPPQKKPQGIPDEEFHGLFCGTTPRYILYKTSHFCELVLPDEIYSNAFKELLDSVLINHEIDYSFITFPDYKCMRFKLDNNALKFLKNPHFSGSFETSNEDLAYQYASFLINNSQITIFQSSHRIEMLILPQYVNFGNDMVNILQQNKIPCQKILNPRTKTQSISFGHSTRALNFIHSLSNASITTKRQDYLPLEAIYTLAKNTFAKI